MFLFTLAAA